jgi:hypothetical protein
MNIQVAVLCDAATDSAGKLNILGTFDTIMTQQLPAVHPQCSIALRATFSNTEEGNHSLVVNFVDEDGHPIMQNFPAIPVQIAVPEDAHFVSRNFIINMRDLTFKTPGFYSIDILLDGKEQANIPLFVKQVHPPQPEGEAWKQAS